VTRDSTTSDPAVELSSVVRATPSVLALETTGLGAGPPAHPPVARSETPTTADLGITDRARSPESP
jgi:hypothetical protein